MFKKDCFAYRETEDGQKHCNALLEMRCDSCKFYTTKSDYNKRVAPLKYKGQGV